MQTNKSLQFISSLLVIVSLLLSGTVQVSAKKQVPPTPIPGITSPIGIGNGTLTPPDGKTPGKQKPENFHQGRITPAERQAAAAEAAAKGLSLPTASDFQSLAGNTVPHYFSVPNYANSPLPVISGAVINVGNDLKERQYATDYAAPVGQLGPVFVVVPTALPNGMVQNFKIFNQTNPGGSPNGSEGNLFHAYILRPTGPNQYLVVFDSGELVVPPASNPGGNIESFAVPNIAVQAGDVIGFYGQGVPVDTGAGADILSYPAPANPLMDSTITLGGAEFPVFNQARTYSFAVDVLDLSGNNTVITGGIRKFVDTLPGLGAGKANNLGQYIPVAVADTTTYPGSDYYEIAVVEYTEKMHSDLPPTKLRGYIQLETSTVQGSHYDIDGVHFGVDNPHYLGPTIVATKDKPVRILFRNLLPTGQGGNLFIPVDTTVMGSGIGPNVTDMMEPDPQNPRCGAIPKPTDCYTENRATLHLHGGVSPWISDGTPHQWITPANETTPYPKGVSVQNVPDMPDPGPGAMTFFYTNQQSARLMFYHDHSWGITRLNVYAGEAAGYLITDPTEQRLVDNGILPAEQLPLIIQDKTFVPSAEQLATTDPTWDTARWGGEGSLWVPHVYSPAQNPGDSSGVNQYGRWAYGPWFWPPTNNIDYPPANNPYYDPNCNPDITWCEPPLIPGTPNVSMGMEAFNDTPVVNGTLYPTVTLEPKSYRLRILNAANDRFWNLSLYQADSTGTEVALNAAEVQAALTDTTVFPTPDTTLSPAGPDWIQIGTEGGFLPSPVVIPAQPTTWVTDPTVFNAGNVDQHSLLLGPAERADVVVDFSQYAGKTLILYNDAPAAFPARDPRYDYYTGNADLRDTGGAPSTLPGYGPNTRTVMQIKIADLPAAPSFNLGALQNAFAHQPDGSGVFESSQNPIIVGQSPYNAAYGTDFRTSGPDAGLVQIFNNSFSFKTLLSGATGASLTFPLQPKQIQDEMGEAFDKEYGRMSGFLGLEAPGANANIQNMILYPFINPASEILDSIDLPPGVNLTPISSTTDGTQIWKITHNGVDTHPIHFHLTDVQLINRVGWDGIIRRPDANELGWKDTVRISPLEDTIVAMRAVTPKIPFGLMDSVRPLNPMRPIGDGTGFNSTDASGNPITPAITNQIVNFGWEYVWHCHILSHEEMDMMRPISALVDRALPAAPVMTLMGEAGTPVTLNWTDGTAVTTDVATWGDTTAEVGYRIERSTGTGAFSTIATELANRTSFTDNTSVAGTSYRYRVVAFNAAGDSASNEIGIGPVLMPPAAPTNLNSTLLPGKVTLTWTDNATNETGFNIERAIVTGGTPGAFASIATVGADVATFNDTTFAPNTTYAYRVFAFNADGVSSMSNVVTAIIPAAPANPTNLTVALQAGPQVRLTFRDNATNETGFIVERSDNGEPFVAIATLARRTNTGNASYTDTNVAIGNVYSYRVFAVNGPARSAPTNTATAFVTVPLAPSNFVVTAVVSGRNAIINMSWIDNSNNETSFQLQRASNATFTAGLNTTTIAANSTIRVETRSRGATIYYRIRAINGVTGASEWVNANPFPIVTP